MRVASYIAAIPFTARLTVAADGWKESMQATVHLLAPTFQPAGVLHPLKPLVAMAPGTGACPPIHLEDTSFSQGLGLTQAYGSAFECFRCVIKFEDDTVDSVQDARVRRRIRCASVAPGQDAPAHAAELTGEAYLVERFGKLPKESYAHALLAWGAPSILTVTAFMPLSDPDHKPFIEFFRTEVGLFQDSVTKGPALQRGTADTPLKMMCAASQANKTSPPQWKTRKVCEAP